MYAPISSPLWAPACRARPDSKSTRPDSSAVETSPLWNACHADEGRIMSRELCVLTPPRGASRRDHAGGATLAAVGRRGACMSRARPSGTGRRAADCGGDAGPRARRSSARRASLGRLRGRPLCGGGRSAGSGSRGNVRQRAGFGKWSTLAQHARESPPRGLPRFQALPLRWPPARYVARARRRPTAQSPRASWS